MPQYEVELGMPDKWNRKVTVFTEKIALDGMMVARFIPIDMPEGV